MRQIFLDTETTGLAAESGDRIVEIGGIEFVNRRPSGRTLHHYFNPERPNHEDAVKVHGLTDTFLADKPRFAELAREIAEFLEGAELVIHNAAFDVSFLDAEFARASLPPVGRIARITDSLAMAREMFPGKSNSLDALCRRLEVDNSGRELHGALLDAGLLAEVYIRMTRGQESLVIDATAAQAEVAMAAIDFGAYELPVIAASAEECAAHDALIAEIDRASGGKARWKAMA
jgi:DNA polymerase-3 subunit epsilon